MGIVGGRIVAAMIHGMKIRRVPISISSEITLLHS